MPTLEQDTTTPAAPPLAADAPSPPAADSPASPAGRLRLTRRQQIVARLLALVLATLLALGLAELFLRLYDRPLEYSWYPRYALVPDPFTGSRFAPNLRLRLSYSNAEGRRFRFSTNAMGFRSRALPWLKSPGAFRVLFVGDSFTEGFGVHDDETFPHYFEAIARRIDPRVEVINAGQNACDLPEYLGLLQGYARRLAPDLIVLSLYAGNDIPIEGPPGPPPRFAVSYGIRTSREYADRLRSFLPARKTKPTREGDVVAPAADAQDRWALIRRPNSWGARLDRCLHEHVLLYQLATDQLLRLRPVRGLLAAIGAIEVESGMPSVVLGRAVAHAFLKERQPDIDAKIRESHEQLRAIRRLCDDLGIPLFVQIIPYPPSLERLQPLWNHLWPMWSESLAARLGRPPRAEDLDKRALNRRFLEMVEAEGLPCVDLAPLDAAGARLDEFHQFTYAASLGHFTPGENLFDALVLLEALARRRLLPEAITTASLAAVWRREFAAVQPPFGAPEPPRVAGQPVASGFAGGRVRSSFAGFEGEAERFMSEGFFTPVFNAQPAIERARQGDWIELQCPVSAGATTVALELCRPAVDFRLHQAVRLSVRLGARNAWSALVQADAHSLKFLAAAGQGAWTPLVLHVPASDAPTTLAVRLDVLRDCAPSSSGEFPVLLRLRRLTAYR